MPAVPLFRAVATKASIANLWALAEADGEVTIFTDSEYKILQIRNKLYAYRSRLRKNNLSLTGVETSTLDGFGFEYGANRSATSPDQAYYLRITYGDEVEFTVLVAEDHVGGIPEGFDLIHESDVPQRPSIDPVDEFHQTAPALIDDIESIPFDSIQGP